MSRNHEDEYSYHFLIEFEDGQKLTESIDSRYKNIAEGAYAMGQVCMMHQDASNVTLERVGRNYA
jgi:hypothetical protein